MGNSFVGSCVDTVKNFLQVNVAQWDLSRDVSAEERWVEVDDADFVDVSAELHQLESSFKGSELVREARAWVAESLYPEEFGLKTLRLKRGLSQAQLARLLNKDASQISRWETKGGNLETSTIVRMAEVLGVNCAVMFDASYNMLKVAESQEAHRA